MRSAQIDSFVRDRLPPEDELPEFLFDLPELQYSERLNAAVELIDKAADPEAIAVVNDRGRWSYAEMAERSDRIARLLVEEGLASGNRVLLLGPNTAMLFAAWLGILKAGGVVVSAMPILRAGEIATILDKAEIGHAIVDVGFTNEFAEAAKRTDRAGKVYRYDGDTEDDMLMSRILTTRPGFAAVDTHRDDPALIAFTSGTTGEPKGCVQYHRDILAPADSFARHILAPDPGRRWACSAPLAFTFGLGMQLIFPWRFGGTAVTIARPGADPLLEAIGRHKINILATAPTAYKAMLDKIDAADVSSLETCVSAGEHLPEPVWRAWHEATGIDIIDGIGATEMMHIFISAGGDAIRPGATGKAVPGYLATVLDEDGRSMASGTGRLAVKGPTGCRYLDDPRQADYVIDGWNVTGDTYRIDDEGYFRYVARSDDMIVSSGYNIAAPEVETALYGHPAVRECAVVGVPCEERGQRVKAFVVLADGIAAGEELAAELQAHVRAAIAPYKYPREVAFVAELPKTATGKLQRYALKEKREG